LGPVVGPAVAGAALPSPERARVVARPRTYPAIAPTASRSAACPESLGSRESPRQKW